VILGVGIDLVEHARFERVLERHGRKFLERVFSPRELAEGDARERSPQGWAARFAAKEAVFKALGGAEIMYWQEIEILGQASPVPRVELGPTYVEFLRHAAPYRIHLSLSHARHASTAVAILERME